MNKKSTDTRYMVMLAMLCGVMLVLQITGIGLIPLPLIKATTMHIPVILGAILLGPSAGGVLGAVFGLCSIWTNTTTPSILSFAFSPVLAFELGGLGSALCAVWTALGCRILLGVSAGWLWRGAKKLRLHDLAALPAVSAAATIFHSLAVMASIALMFGEQYAQAKNVATGAVFGVAMGVVATSGIPEAIASVLIVTAIGKASLSIFSKRQPRRR